MAVKSVEERFNLVVESIKGLSEIAENLHEASVLGNGMRKSLSDVMTTLSSIILILEPEKGEEFIQQHNAGVQAKYGVEGNDSIVEVGNQAPTMSGGYI